VISARLQSERIGGGLFDWAVLRFAKDAEKLEKRGDGPPSLFQTNEDVRDFSMVHLFEALFFISIAAEILIPPIGVLLGLDSRRHRTLFPIGRGTAVFVTLTRMWDRSEKDS
jgi:hypothetical protein